MTAPDHPHRWISAFLEAQAAELGVARAQRGFSVKQRYLPIQWGAHAEWRTHAVSDGEPWFGFEAVRQIAGLPPELLLIPLPGHTDGHMGVAVNTATGWLLHVGDAFYDPAEIDGGGPVGMKAFQWWANMDHTLAKANRARLGELIRNEPNVTVFCAHDPVALTALAQA